MEHVRRGFPYSSDMFRFFPYSLDMFIGHVPCPNCKGKIGCTVRIRGGAPNIACLERQCPAGTFNAASGRCSGQVTGDEFYVCAAEFETVRSFPTGRCSGRGGGTECVCTRCPKGKYSGAVGATSADTCVDCVSARYSDADGMATCEGQKWEEDQPRMYVSTPPPSEMENKERSTAVIIGAVVGGTAAIVCILALCYHLRRRQSKHPADNAQHASNTAGHQDPQLTQY